MRKTIAVASIAALGFVAPAFAEEEFSYNYVELGYVHSHIDNVHASGHGYGISGSYGFAQHVHGFATYSDSDLDFNLNLKTFDIGAGLNWPVSPKLDVIGTVSYVDLKLDTPAFGSAHDSGLGLGAALRGRLTEALEVRGGVDYVNLNDNGDLTTGALGARFYFSQMFGLGADATFNGNGMTWMLGARLDFATF